MNAGSQGSSADSESGDVFADARWFPENLDGRTGELSFVLTDRKALAEQTFLDSRWDRGRAQHKRLAGRLLFDRLPAELPRMNFIWHTGFCCSTLLAKAIDWPERNLSLCEPQILVELAHAKRAGLLAGERVNLPHLVFHLLARSFSPGSLNTAKAAPVANFLLPEAAQQTAGSHLFLYSDCRSFLISLIKMGEDGRGYARRMFLALFRDGHVQSQWPAPQLQALSGLEGAAVVWHMQIAEFRRNWPLVSARARSLDCDAFLDAPGETLNRLDQFFSLSLGADHLARVSGGSLFGRNAKTGAPSYSTAKRREEHEQINRQMGAAIDQAVARSYELCPDTPRGAPLPNPLVSR